MKTEVDKVAQEEITQTIIGDKKDRRILELLQVNSSQSLKDIAKKDKIHFDT